MLFRFFNNYSRTIRIWIFIFDSYFWCNIESNRQQLETSKAYVTDRQVVVEVLKGLKWTRCKGYAIVIGMIDIYIYMYIQG